jgi:hypothetical protein
VTGSRPSSSAFNNLNDVSGSYLEMSSVGNNNAVVGVRGEDDFSNKVDRTIDSILTATLSGPKTGNIFELVAAALEKQRVATGLLELRNEVKSLRIKNSNLRMQLEEMEKMMDANIEDRERVISQRNEQISTNKNNIADLEAAVYELTTSRDTLLAVKDKEILSQKSVYEDRISELENTLNGLEEFRNRRVAVTAVENDYKAKITELEEKYMAQISNMEATHKSNEIRWADDIRKQRAKMEATVTQSIHDKIDSENETIRNEHHQMGLDLKHQSALMKSVMVEEGKRKAELGEVRKEIVVSKTMQMGFLRKLRFVTKKLKLAEKKLEFFRSKGFNINAGKHAGELSLEDDHIDDHVNVAVTKAVTRHTSMVPGAGIDDTGEFANDVVKATQEAMQNAMRMAFEEGDKLVEEEEEEQRERELSESDMNENMAFLSSVTKELKEHLQGRDDWQRDVEMTKQFNDFVARQIVAADGALAGSSVTVNNKMKQILAKKRAKSVAADAVKGKESAKDPERESVEGAVAAARDAMSRAPSMAAARAPSMSAGGGRNVSLAPVPEGSAKQSQAGRKGTQVHEAAAAAMAALAAVAPPPEQAGVAAAPETQSPPGSAQGGNFNSTAPAATTAPLSPKSPVIKIAHRIPENRRKTQLASRHDQHRRIKGGANPETLHNFKTPTRPSSTAPTSRMGSLNLSAPPKSTAGNMREVSSNHAEMAKTLHDNKRKTAVLQQRMSHLHR